MAKITQLFKNFPKDRLIFKAPEAPQPQAAAQKAEQILIKEPSLEDINTAGIEVDASKPFDTVAKVVADTFARNKSRIDKFRLAARQANIKPEEKAALEKRADILLAKLEGAAEQALKGLQAKYEARRKELIDKKVAELRKGLEKLVLEGSKVEGERARVEAVMGKDFSSFASTPEGKQWLQKNAGELRGAMLKRSAQLRENGNVIEEAAHKHAEYIETLIDDGVAPMALAGAISGAAAGGYAGFAAGTVFPGAGNLVSGTVGLLGGAAVGALGLGGLGAAADQIPDRGFDDIVGSEYQGIDYNEDTTAGWAQGIAYAMGAEGGLNEVAKLISYYQHFERNEAEDDGNMQMTDFVKASKNYFKGFDIGPADAQVMAAMQQAFGKDALITPNMMGADDIKAPYVTRAAGYGVGCLALAAHRFKTNPELKSQYESYFYASIAEMGKNGQEIWNMKKLIMSPKLWEDSMMAKAPKLDVKEKEQNVADSKELIEKNAKFVTEQSERLTKYAETVKLIQDKLGIKKTVDEMKPVADLLKHIAKGKVTIFDTTSANPAHMVAQVKVEKSIMESVDVAASKEGKEIVSMLDRVKTDGEALANEALAGKKNELMAKMAEQPIFATISAMMNDPKHPAFAKMQGPEGAPARAIYDKVVNSLKGWETVAKVDFDKPESIVSAIETVEKTGKEILDDAKVLAFLNTPEKSGAAPGKLSDVVKVDGDMSIEADGSIKFTSKRAENRITLGSRSDAPALIVNGKLAAKSPKNGEYYYVKNGRLSGGRVKIFGGFNRPATTIEVATAQQIADAKAAQEKGHKIYKRPAKALAEKPEEEKGESVADAGKQREPAQERRARRAPATIIEAAEAPKAKVPLLPAALVQALDKAGAESNPAIIAQLRAFKGNHQADRIVAAYDKKK